MSDLEIVGRIYLLMIFCLMGGLCIGFCVFGLPEIIKKIKKR